jgi:outer membrane protein assembly factor BamB
MLNAAPTAGGAMDNERVYVPVEGGGLRAFARETGEPIWDAVLETTWPPVPGNTSLFVGSPGRVVALDAETGGVRWSRPLSADCSAPLLLLRDSIVAATDNGEVLALRTEDGGVIWTRQVGSRTRHTVARLVSRDAIVLVLDDNRIIALETKSGSVLWERSLPGTLSAPATARDRVFVGSTNNFFYALDSDSGEEAWRWRTGGDVVGAAAADDRVYFVSLDNILRGVNRSNGNQQWKAQIPTRPSTPPIAVGDVVVMVGVAPRLDGFVGKTGAVLGSYTAATDLVGAPAIDANLQPFRVALAVFTRDGRITALRSTRMTLPDPPLVPLLKLPGRELPPERLTIPKPHLPTPK